MSVRVDEHWSYNGHPVIRIENGLLAADIVPSLGGKILHLIDKRADRNVLWRNPRVLPHAGPIGANVDDHFSGGWDDAFPTGAPSLNRYGDQLPYLGEIWNLTLAAHVEEAGPDRATVVLTGTTPITPARWTRTITLQQDLPVLRLDTRIENIGYLPFDLNWGSHASLTVAPGFRVDVPAGRGTIPDAGGHVLGEIDDEYVYPLLRSGTGDELDVRFVLPPTAGTYALHVLEDLREGWVAVTDIQNRRGFGIVFDSAVHRAVWQWMVYGGFRGWYHVIIEPWVAGPPVLADAVAAGSARALAPGEALDTTMYGVLYEGVESVSRLQADGSVEGE